MDLNEIRSIMENKLIIDCPYIRLIPQLSDSTKKIHEGSGSIIQNQEGALLLKMYCAGGISFKDVFGNAGDPAPGEIYGEKHYYQLLAKDISGREWESKRILLDIHAGADNNGYVVYSDIREIEHSSKVDNKNNNRYANIYFPGEIDVPFNKWTDEETIVGGERRIVSGGFNLAEFNSCDYKFNIETKMGGVRLNAYSSSQELNDVRLMRVIESLQFVLSRSLSWSISEIYEGQEKKIRIRSCQRNSKQVRISPPVNMDGPFSSAWSLFDKYLGHIISYKDDHTWHPISIWVHTLIESNFVSLDVESLLLSVAIEGLLRDEFDHFKSIDSKLRAEVDKTLNILKNSDLSSTFQKRLEGLLSAMLTPRVKDFLNILKERNLVDLKLIEAYDSLRNPFAHGDFGSISNPQKQLDYCASVRTLFYQLIFLAIGYKGKYIDYSMRGFLVKEFNKSF